jgi:serine/threonine protein kinase
MSLEGLEAASEDHLMTVPFTAGQELVDNRAHGTQQAWKEDSGVSSSDTEPEEEDLKDKLLASMQTSRFEKTPSQFLPRDKFEAIFSAQPRDRTLAIFEPMGVKLAAPTADDLSLAKHILEHCRALYLIAVFIELKPEPLRTLMSIFRRDEFTDRRLPIDVWPGEKIKAEKKNHPLVVMEKLHEPARTLHIWNLKSIAKFQSEQWKFLIPTISTSDIFHDFGQRTVPFVVKHNFVGKGGNGIVHKYEIHHAHFEDTQPSLKTDEPSRTISEQRVMRNVVAVKEIRKDGNEVAKRWEKEVRALARMNTFSDKHIVRFITSFVRRGTSDDVEHYVMFEWADGGNLSDFRAACPNPELTPTLIKWVTRQLCGIAQALSKAHYLDEEGSYRHGDLKPANILWFKQGHTEFGTLKIGDWGEAKEHYNRTEDRDQQGHDTTTKYGTRRYEPPEVETGLRFKLSPTTSNVRSRLYDIWGIGCITLEFLIWLIYGLDELKRFNKQNIGDYGVSEMFYEVSFGKPAKVHAVVEYRMEQMAKEPCCSRGKTALGDLLDIVRTGLLIVKLPPDGGARRPHLDSNNVLEKPHSNTSGLQPLISSSEIFDTGGGNDIAIQVTQDLQVPTLASPEEPTRCLATDFEDRLKEILANEHDDYWFTRYTSKSALVDYRRPGLLSADSAAIAPTREAPSPWYDGMNQEDYGPKNPPDQETWIFDQDNSFAEDIFSRFKRAGVPPPRAALVSNKLCDKCLGVREELWSPYFEKTYEVVELKRVASEGKCDLCELLWNTYQKFSTTASPKVKFRREGYMIMMDGLKSPVLTLFKNNGTYQLAIFMSEQKTDEHCIEPRSQASNVQIGLPILPTPGEDTHLEILRGWLDDCDCNHACAPRKFATARVPTRLIDVGTNGGNVVHLREAGLLNSDDWVALSYQWGPTPHFSTTIETKEAHLAGMNLNQLPRTFRDAVKITRCLKKRYLWIDSLCIIQGEGGDFSEESKRMEDVYSGAYCVLAASCAAGQRSGFLSPLRTARTHVTLEASNDPDSIFYVCEKIENFREHVLEGALCRRGWVFQEHALARRTIFFTKYQTYWECGKGIRCESLAKMKK